MKNDRATYIKIKRYIRRGHYVRGHERRIRVISSHYNTLAAEIRRGLKRTLSRYRLAPRKSAEPADSPIPTLGRTVLSETRPETEEYPDIEILSDTDQTYPSRHEGSHHAYSSTGRRRY